MKTAPRQRIEVNVDELDRVLDEARQAPLSEDDYQTLKTTLHALIDRLRPNSPRSEKMSSLFEGQQPPASQPEAEETPPAKPAGHGRNGAEVLHNDDTSMRVLHLARAPDDERTGVFTSGIISVAEGCRIALFFTGRQHAGENIADVLRQRSAELPAPVQMCDASSSNTSAYPEGVKILLANCLAHNLESGFIWSS